jgi:hypothetical protein
MSSLQQSKCHSSAEWNDCSALAIGRHDQAPQVTLAHQVEWWDQGTVLPSTGYCTRHTKRESQHWKYCLNDVKTEALDTSRKDVDTIRMNDPSCLGLTNPKSEPREKSQNKIANSDKTRDQGKSNHKEVSHCRRIICKRFYSSFRNNYESQKFLTPHSEGAYSTCVKTNASLVSPDQTLKTDSSNLQAKTNSNPGSRIPWRRDSRHWSSLLCSLVIEVHYCHFRQALNCKITAFKTPVMKIKTLTRKFHQPETQCKAEAITRQGIHSSHSQLQNQDVYLSNCKERVITRLRVSKRRSPMVSWYDVTQDRGEIACYKTKY